MATRSVRVRSVKRRGKEEREWGSRLVEGCCVCRTACGSRGEEQKREDERERGGKARKELGDARAEGEDEGIRQGLWKELRHGVARLCGSCGSRESSDPEREREVGMQTDAEDLATDLSIRKGLGFDDEVKTAEVKLLLELVRHGDVCATKGTEGGAKDLFAVTQLADAADVKLEGRRALDVVQDVVIKRRFVVEREGSASEATATSINTTRTSIKRILRGFRRRRHERGGDGGNHLGAREIGVELATSGDLAAEFAFGVFEG